MPYWYATWTDLINAGVTFSKWSKHHRARRKKLTDMEQRKELW